MLYWFIFFFQAEDGIRDSSVTGVQTCALPISVDVVNGWSDWDQDVQFIVDDLNAAGIKATINTETGFTPYYTAITTGSYDAAISLTNSGPTPYFPYQALLISANSAPAGEAVVGTNIQLLDA